MAAVLSAAETKNLSKYRHLGRKMLTRVISGLQIWRRGRPESTTGSLSGRPQLAHRRTMVLKRRRCETAKKGSRHLGQRNVRNQFPATRAKIIQARAASKAGSTLPQSRLVTSATVAIQGTYPKKAIRLRFLRMRYPRQSSVGVCILAGYAWTPACARSLRSA